MTDVRLAVYTTLDTVAALQHRIYEGVFPQPPALPVWPAARFTFVGDTPYPALCGDSDLDADDVRVQVDIVSGTSTAALRTLRASVITAMQSVIVQPGEQPLPSTRETDLYEYDADTKTHRQVIDFVLFPSSV